jgi:hypothetical protein
VLLVAQTDGAEGSDDWGFGVIDEAVRLIVIVGVISLGIAALIVVLVVFGRRRAERHAEE